MIADPNRAPIGAIIAERAFGPIGRQDLQRYAQASGDSNPLHLDRDFARQAGFRDVIVHGMFGMALLGRLIQDDIGGQELIAFRTTFRKVIEVDQALVCRARLASRVNNTAVLALEMVGPNDVVLIDGSATVEFHVAANP
jgi:hypothetical protein